MYFTDQYEDVTSDGCIFDVEVEGNLTEGGGVTLTQFTASDGSGNLLEDDDIRYEELKEKALERDYNVEDHNANFDFYETNLAGIYGKDDKLL